MDSPASVGSFGVLECFSHEILEKVAFFLDLDNLKKLSKVSTTFRDLAISVSAWCLQLFMRFFGGILHVSDFFAATCLVLQMPSFESQAHCGGN
jgi:hypothetical protein